MTKGEQVDTRIAELEAQLKDPPQQRAEVYSRIVGYYRVVDNWNPGKRDEYRHRVSFSPNGTPTRHEAREKKRTTFRSEQAGALSSVLDSFEDFDLTGRQEGVNDFDTCESCQ